MVGRDVQRDVLGAHVETIGEEIAGSAAFIGVVILAVSDHFAPKVRLPSCGLSEEGVEAVGFGAFFGSFITSSGFPMDVSFGKVALKLIRKGQAVMQLKLTLDEVRDFVAREFPQMADIYRVDAVGPMSARVSMMPDERHLRPGATVSGPTIFGLADCGVYFALMAMIGPEALAVTTNGSIDFMRKPVAGKALVAEVTLLKVGRVLAVGDVAVHSDGSQALIARATFTYSIPPKG